MKPIRTVLLLLLTLGLAGTASALQTDELIALTTMPLAVADVVAIPEVPQSEVITVVTTLNQAAVPAPQFVEVVRYIPVAVAEPAEPRFVTYVTQEYQRGVIGEPLALAIADRYDTYGYDDVQMVNPPVVTYVERQQFLPTVVTTRYQPVSFDPLALIAMPLAVAAVAEITDVPSGELMQLVSSLNRALVPAPQFVEVVRYSPVVLVDRTASPQFLQFVSTEYDRGIIGRPLAYSIAERIEDYAPLELNVIEVEPARFFDDDVILPAPVTAFTTTRVARAHPHGGAPGQLKKERGVQTGAEIVHGSRPGQLARSSVERERTARVSEPRTNKESKRTRVARSEARRTSKQRVARSSESSRPARVTRTERKKPAVREERVRVKQQRVQAEPRRAQRTRVEAAPAQRGGGNQVRGNSGGKGNSGGSQGNSGGKGNGKGKGKG
jgi:hypothetical protein